jgi:Uma2 family endonuclease
VVEIAVTTLRFDLTVKAGLYARAGIVHYLVVDAAGRRSIVHRQPEPRGRGSIITYNESEKVLPHTSPQFELPAGGIFLN